MGDEWCKIYGITRIHAARRAKVQVDGQQSKGYLFVKKWVKDAMDLYEANQERYAGMELVEFLARMKPDDIK